MTTEAWTIAPVYTVAGIGPYAIPHPYTTGAIQAFVTVAGARVALTGADYTLTPTAADATGNLFLSPTAAATHAGRPLTIDRATTAEQGWVGIQGEREKGLEVQLDRIVQGLQEATAMGAGALRVRGAVLPPVTPVTGATVIYDGAAFVPGPTASAIAAAQANAVSADIDASRAEVASAAAIEAAPGNILLRKAAKFLVVSDIQAKTFDNRSGVPSRYQMQVPAARAMWAEFRANHAHAVQAAIVPGDVVDRPRFSGGAANEENLAMGTSYQPGDLYGYGYREFLKDMFNIGGIPISRFFPLAGNHDSARGLREYEQAWTKDDFRQTFGALDYPVIFGDLGFYMLSDSGGAIGGQINPLAIEIADAFMAEKRHIKWIVCYHQPHLNYGPSDSYVTRPVFTAPSPVAVVTVGEYYYQDADALRVYLGTYPSGTLLVPGVDYTYVSVAPGDGQDEGTLVPMTQITLTVPLTTGQTVQARVANWDNYQDKETSDRLEALLTKYQDNIIAVMYGHRGNIADPASLATRYDAVRDIYFCNNNMGLPDRVNSGLNAVSHPLVYSILSVDPNAATGGTTISFRRWNSTAQQWLEDTNPALNVDFTVELPEPLSLSGDEPSFNGLTRQFGGVLEGRELKLVKDLADRDLPNAGPVPPGDPWPTNVPGWLRLGVMGVTDMSLRDAQVGDSWGIDHIFPNGVSGDVVGRVAWIDTPFAYGARTGFEITSGSETNILAQYFIDLHGERYFEVDETRGAVFAPRGYGPMLIHAPATSTGNNATSPQNMIVLETREGVQDLGVGEGVRIQAQFRNFGDLVAKLLGSITWEGRLSTDLDRLSDFKIALPASYGAVERDVLVIEADTGVVNLMIAATVAGKKVQVADSGATGARPTTGRVTGQQYFDTTLGIPVWWNGSVWKNASGATV